MVGTDRFRILTDFNTPTNADGEKGEMRFDENYFYIATDDKTWKTFADKDYIDNQIQTGVKLNYIQNPDDDTLIVVGGNNVEIRFTNPVGGWLFNMTGGWSGHVLEINDTSTAGDGSAGDHLFHAETNRANVIAGHFINSDSGTALKIEGIIEADTLVGVITMFGSSSAPNGWLNCDGSAINRTTYSNLFAVIGTTYGVGDGSTTFNLPDFRGIFPRGAGTNGTLTDANGSGFSSTLGTYQNDSFQGHEHTVPGQLLTPAGGSTYRNIGGAANNNSTTIAIVTDGSNGTPRTDVETRPANLSVNFIIKY